VGPGRGKETAGGGASVVTLSFVTCCQGRSLAAGGGKFVQRKSASPVPDLVYWAWSGVSD
jgi:hypothetical protein